MRVELVWVESAAEAAGASVSQQADSGQTELKPLTALIGWSGETGQSGGIYSSVL